MKAAKHLVEIVAAFALIVLGVVSLNVAAAVINPATGDAEVGASLAETNGNVMNIDIRVDEPAVVGRLAIDSDLLGQVLDSDIVSTSVVPLPAAAWMFGAALFGLLSVARRRQTKKS